MPVKKLSSVKFKSDHWYGYESGSSVLDLAVYLSDQITLYNELVKSGGMPPKPKNKSFEKYIKKFVDRGAQELYAFLNALNKTDQQHISNMVRAAIEGATEIVPESLPYVCVRTAYVCNFIIAINESNFCSLVRELIAAGVPVLEHMVADVAELIESKDGPLTSGNFDSIDVLLTSVNFDSISYAAINGICDAVLYCPSYKYFGIVAAIEKAGLREYAEKLTEVYTRFDGKCPSVTIIHD